MLVYLQQIMLLDFGQIRAIEKHSFIIYKIDGYINLTAILLVKGNTEHVPKYNSMHNICFYVIRSKIMQECYLSTKVCFKIQYKDNFYQ